MRQKLEKQNKTENDDKGYTVYVELNSMRYQRCLCELGKSVDTESCDVSLGNKSNWMDYGVFGQA